MAKITNSIQKQVINQDGVILRSEEERTVNWGTEPNYIKLYLDDILYLSDLPKGLNSTLYALLKRMSYGNQLVINAALKRQIANEIGLSVSSINNAITKFVKGRLLERIDTGLYLVNPHLFGKGEWKDIAKIRLNVIFDSNGKTIMAEIDRVDDINISKTAQIKISDELTKTQQESLETAKLDKMQEYYDQFEENRESEERFY